MLIVDNITNLSLIKNIVPREIHGDLLLTTTIRSFGNTVLPIELKEFTVEEGTEFLLHRARIISQNSSTESISDKDAQSAKTIVTALGGLPLAIDQAGAYIEELHVSLKDYESIYQEETLELLNRRGKFALDHQSVVRTFLLAVDKIKENTIAKDILEVMALLSENSIPLEIFSDSASHLGNNIGLISNSKHQLNEALALIFNFSLIKRNPTTDTVEIHKLVQQTLKASMETELQLTWIKRIIDAISDIFPYVTYKNWPKCKRLFPHATLIASYIKSLKIESSASAYLLLQLGYYCYEQAYYSQAKNYFLEAIEIANKVANSEDILIEQGNSFLGLVSVKQGNFSEAITFFQKSLEIKKQRYDIKDNLAPHMHNLAVCYLELNRSQEAEEILSQCVSSPEETMEEPYRLATATHNLASVYHKLRKYQKSQELFLKALSISTRAFGNDSIEVAHVIYGLSSLNYSTNDFIEAEKTCLRALNIRRKIYTDGHPDVASCLQLLANIYIKTEKFFEAKPLIFEALTWSKEFFGETHLHTAELLTLLAQVLYFEEKYEEAEETWLKILKIQEDLLSTSNSIIANTCVNIGRFYYYIKSFEHAETYSLKAKDIYLQHFGSENKEIAVVNYNLAAIKYNQGLVKEARPLLFSSFSNLAHLLGFDNPKTASCFIELLRFCHENNESLDQIENWQSMLSAIEKSPNSKHLDLGRIYTSIGGCYCNQKQYLKAKPYFEKALSVDETIYGKDNIKTCSSLGDVAKTYSQTGNITEAKQIWYRLLSIKEKFYGSQNLETATTLYEIGIFQTENKNYKEAETYFYRSLNIRKTLLGEKDSLVAKSLNALGVVFFENKDYDKAKQFYNRSLEILEKPNNKKEKTVDELLLSEVLINLSQVHINIYIRDRNNKHNNSSNLIESTMISKSLLRNNLIKAENFAKKALDLFNNLKNSEELRLADIQENLAGSYYLQGKNYNQAKDLFKECLTIRKKILGLNNRLVAVTYANLALVHEKLHEPKKAKSMKDISKKICDKLKIKPFSETTFS